MVDWRGRRRLGSEYVENIHGTELGEGCRKKGRERGKQTNKQTMPELKPTEKKKESDGRKIFERWL